MKIRALLIALILLPGTLWAEEKIVSEVTDFGELDTQTNNSHYTLTNGTTYKLNTGVTTSLGYLYIKSGSNVVIDLNGYSINRNLNTPTYTGFVILNEGTLTIKNTGGGAEGKITGGYNIGSGGGIYNKGDLTIEGGTITGNKAKYWQNPVDLIGHGGGIMVESGTLHLKGGIITGNKSSLDDTRGGQGGGIYINSGATLTIEGAPQITGNIRYSDDKKNNIYLTSGVVINIGTSGLTDANGTIGISMQALGTITSGLNSAEKYSVFVSDDNHFETAANGTEAQLYTCWMGLVNKFNAGGDIALSSSKVYEASSSDPCLTVPSENTVTLNLNGQTLNRKLIAAKEDGCVIKNLGTLNITTSDGIITGGYNSTGGGGIHNMGILTMSTGQIKSNKSTNQGGGVYNIGSMTLSGGTITTNEANNTNGGGIYNTGTLTISGGKINSNSATETSRNGGGIYNAGTLSISGGEIKSNTATGLGAGIYHDGSTFNLQGAPDISGNASNNVYLTTDHHIITVNGTLSNTTAIGITMQTLGIFTSGLSTKGSIGNFSSEVSTTVKLVTGAGSEAELLTYWNHLNRLLASDSGVSSYELEAGKTYQASDGDAYLHVPSGKTFTLSLGDRTLNRNLSSATSDGCVIYNEGNLTINGTGTITGGKNSDLGTTKGGGICNTNTGTLTIAGGTISNNTTAQYGGGIYNTGTLNIEGGNIQSNTASEKGSGIYHNGTAFCLQGSPTISSNTTNNVYLETGKTIAISGTLNNSAAIGIASTESRIVFTSGLSGKGDASKFTANQSGKGIGLNGDGEAIIGPSYNISRSEDYTGTSATLYIKNVTSGTQTAVEGEVVKVKVTTDGIPISLGYSPGVSLSPYPKSNVEYSFVMPASNVTVESVCRWGGYCGVTSEEDIKYYIDNQVLKFITKDDANNYSMASYAPGLAPWVNQTYTSVEIPKRLTAISNYAFCDKNQHLASFTVDAANTSFKADGGLLFNNDKTQLICYPSGKTDAETYTVPAAVTAIQDGAFAFNTTLKTISVAGGSSFTAGADGVLYNLAGTSLICYPAGKTEESYTIAATVTAIKPYAFQSCSALRNLYVLRSTEETITAGGTCMLDGTDSSLKIIVKSGSVTAYKEADFWIAYKDKIVAMDLSNSITITLDSSDPFDYTGSAITPTITVRDIVGTVLTIGTDYIVDYSNNIAVGTGHITVTGQGNYTGSKTIDFYITRNVSFLNSTKDYATYYSNEDLEIMSGGKAYVITGVDWTTGDITTVQVDYIKAQTPVILYKSGIGNAGNNPYHLKAHTGSDYPDLYGYFMGKLSATSYNDLKTSGISDIYILRGSSFAKVVSSSGNLPANRCYLARPSVNGSRGIDSLSLEGGGDATSLIEVKDEEMNNNEWYTLDGRKLQGKPTKKGVYVSKGKKIVVH